MRKKQIISSLMVTSIMLANMSPLVTFAEEAEVKNSPVNVEEMMASRTLRIKMTGASQNLVGNQYLASVSFKLPLCGKVKSVAFLKDDGSAPVYGSEITSRTLKPEQTYSASTPVSKKPFIQAVVSYTTIGSKVHYGYADFNTPASNQKPIIYASDSVLTVGDSFNPLKGVTAIDFEDGNLTSKVRVLTSNVDMTKAGKYCVYYVVQDSDGNSTVKPVNVTVKEAPTNEKPVITASDKTLTVGDSFNPLTGVTAADKEDGNVTSKLKVTANTVDTTKAGTYSVTYSVTDSDNNTTTKTIVVIVKEAPTNEKPVITASDKTLTVGDSFNPLTGVTAADKEDGNVTSKLKVTANTVDTTKAGTYSVTYSVTDSDNNTTTKTIVVLVKEAPTNEKPVITASDKTLTVGDSFNPLTGVTAADKEDGNVTSKLKVTANTVDTTKAGTYSVTYSVTDSDNNTTTKTIVVTVKALPITGHPVIAAMDTKIFVGQTFDPTVVGMDSKGGFMDSSYIRVVYNNVNSNIIGTYMVAYVAMDKYGATATKTISVTVEREPLPESRPVIKFDSKVMFVGEKFNPKADVTAYDENDGDLTDKIIVIENNVDTSKPGFYFVYYSVANSQGYVENKSRLVCVIENNKPVIEAKDQTLKVGDTFDALANVVATDEEDGDLTSEIKVTENTVDTTKAGTYSVTYSVTDSDNNTTTKQIEVVVTATTNEFPVISAKDKTHQLGNDFDPYVGVTATDKEDGDLTSKIKVSGRINVDKEGTYEITYSVTDSAGNTTTKTITVTVEDKLKVK